MNTKEISNGLEEMRKWLQTQPHLPKSISNDEELLRAFIVGCRSIDLAKLKLDAYFSLRSQYRESFFLNRDPLNINWSSVKKHFFLPGTTPDGDLVIFTTIPQLNDQKKFSAAESAKVNFMILDSFLKEYGSKPLSIYLVTDLANLNNDLMMKLNKYSRQCYEIMETYPVRIKGIISFNAPDQGKVFTEKFLKPFADEEIKNKIKMSGRDHHCIEEHFPVDILPSNYKGGKNPPIDSLWMETRQRLERERDWFITIGSKFTDEKLRP